jgi:hypothetical protein
MPKKKRTRRKTKVMSMKRPVTPKLSPGQREFKKEARKSVRNKRRIWQHIDLMPVKKRGRRKK